MVNGYLVLAVVLSAVLSSWQRSLCYAQTFQDVAEVPDATSVNGGTQGLAGNGDTTESSTNVFANFIAPIIKYNMMTTGNKTEFEAQNILNLITARMNVSSTGTTDVTAGNPFAAGGFFKDYIAPLIKQGMVTSGNKTEEEAEAITDMISTAVEMKSKFEDVRTEAISSPTPPGDVTATPSSPVEFFENYVSPIIRIGIRTSGTKTQSEADDILKTISAAVEDRTIMNSKESDESFTAPPIKSPDFFADYIAPVIKHGIMINSNKTEIEADAIMGVISSSIKSRREVEQTSALNSVVSPDKYHNISQPGELFQNFIAPLIRFNMVNTQNKTGVEADAILNIISDSMTTKQLPNAPAPISPRNSTEFFANYVAPMIRIRMTSLGNKTELEADAILHDIIASIANGSTEKPVSKFPFTGEAAEGDDGDGSFFTNDISPLIKYHMVNTGNKTDKEADAILDIISTSIEDKPEESESENPDVQEESFVDDGGDDAKKNISFFQEFVVPIIRYSIINSGNKTAEETDAILDIISTEESVTADTDSSPQSGNFFEDFIAPIIRNKIIGESTKNESEVDAIIYSIIEKEREMEAAENSGEPVVVDVVDEMEASRNVTQKFINGMLLPEMNKALDDISISDTVTDITDAQVAKATKEAVVGIDDEFAEVIETKEIMPGTSDDGDSGYKDSASSDASNPSEDSTSSETSKSSDSSSEDSQYEESSETSDESVKDYANIAAVDTFVKSYLGPVLNEKINTLQTLTTFFSNPKVIEQLRQSLQDIATADNGSIDGDDETNGEDSSKETPMGPVKWFVDQLVIPELQQNAKRLDNVVQFFHSLQENKSIPEAIYQVVSERFAKESNDKDNATPSKSAKEFFSEVVVPRIKQAVKRFQNMTSSMTTQERQSVIVRKVNDFMDRIIGIKSLISAAKTNELEQNLKENSDQDKIPSTINKQKTPDNSFGRLVGEAVASAFKKSGDRLRTLAAKMSDPAVSDKIVNVLKSKINSAIESRKQKPCTGSSCSDSRSNENSFENSNGGSPGEIIKKIVKTKIQISEDRSKINELETKMAGKDIFYGNNMELLLQKLKLVQDIKKSAITLRQLFTNLRKGQPFKGQAPQIGQSTYSKGYTNPTTDPYIALQNDIQQITQAHKDIEEYGQKLNEMDLIINTMSDDNPDKFELVRKKLKLVWNLKDSSVKLNEFYRRLPLDKRAVFSKEREDMAQLDKSQQNFEIQFTEAEKAKYEKSSKGDNVVQITPPSKLWTNMGSFENSNGADSGEIIKQIVKTKIQISEDRSKINELETKMAGKDILYGNNMELLLHKLKLVQDIKNSAITLRQLFTSLRTGQPIKVQAPQIDETSSPKTITPPSTDPHIVLQNDIKQITQTQTSIQDYTQKLNEMDQTIYAHYDDPNRLELVRDKLKMVGALGNERIKLNQLYNKLRLDQNAVYAKEMEEKSHKEKSPESFEMQFTEAEKSKYAGMLQELSFSRIPSSPDTHKDGLDDNTVTGLIVSGVLMSVITGCILTLLFRKRRGKQRLYTYIPTEERVDSRSLLAPKDTYGSCK